MSDQEEQQELQIDEKSLPSRTDFDAKISKLIGGKRIVNSAYFDQETYSKFIAEVKECQAKKKQDHPGLPSIETIRRP